MSMQHFIMFFVMLLYVPVIAMDGPLRAGDKVFLNACKNEKISPQLIGLLRAQGVNFKVTDPENGFTGLDYLCYNKNFELLKIMLAQQVYTIDNIFFSACEVHALDKVFIDFIVSQGGSINAVDPGNGYTGLHYACFSGALDVYKALIDRGAAVTLDKEGNSLLHTACSGGLSMPLIAFLIESGVYHINGKNYCGRTPLHYACVNASADVVQVLLDAGAQQLADEYGETPLHVVYQQENCPEDELVTIINILINQNKSFLNVLDNNGRTPLHNACEFSSPFVVCFLLENGAEQMRDNKGESPLDCSEYNETYSHEAIQHILKAHLKSALVVKKKQKNILHNITNVLPKKDVKKNKNEIVGKKKKKKKKTKVVTKSRGTDLSAHVNTLGEEKSVTYENNLLIKDETKALLLDKKSEIALLECVQAKAIEMVTGQDKKDVAKNSYAAMVSLGAHQQEPASEELKKEVTWKDNRTHLQITACISAEKIKSVSGELAENPLALAYKNCSAHVINKKNNPSDVLHCVLPGMEESFGLFASSRCIGKGKILYELPATLKMPRHKNTDITRPAILEWIVENGELVHRFIRPKKNKKQLLLLPSC